MRQGATCQPPAGPWTTLRSELRIGERGSLRAHLIRGASGSLALKVTAMLLSLATGVLLARALGASGLGIYAYAFAWLELLKIPAALGLPVLVTREVAVYTARRDWGRLRGLLVRANQAVLGMSLMLMLLAGGTTWLLADWFRSDALTTFWLALILLPLFGLMNLRSACLNGLQRVILGQIPDALIRPVSFLALLGVVYLVNARLTPEVAMRLQILAVSCAFVAGAVWLLRSLPREVRSAAPAFETRAWAGSALPFLFMGGLHLINGQTDLIMLGWLGTAADVGVYRVVTMAAVLVIFTVASVHTVLSPMIARLHAEGDMLRLQRVVTRSSRIVLLSSLPAALALVLFGGWLLPGIFGQEYAVGSIALAILALAHLVNAATSLAGPLLSMTGHQREEARTIASSAFLNVALNAILIPLWGINGAALATAASLITRDVLVVILVHRRLGLKASALRPLPLELLSALKRGPFP